MTAKFAHALTATMLALSTVTACNDSTSADHNDPKIPSSSSAEDREGMIRVPASDTKVSLTEKMASTLAYDYFIGIHEVTCGEYGDKNCANDSLPVANVTFFDAVLFANAKSKAEKLDTVYTYSKATFDSQNH